MSCLFLLAVAMSLLCYNMQNYNNNFCIFYHYIMRKIFLMQLSTEMIKISTPFLDLSQIIKVKVNLVSIKYKLFVYQQKAILKLR